MNKDFEDIRRAIETLIANVEPEHLAHAIAQYAVGLDEGKRFRAGVKDHHRDDRTDGWRGRVSSVIDVEDKARGGELG